MQTRPKAVETKKFGKIELRGYINGPVSIVPHHKNPELIEVIACSNPLYRMSRFTLERKQAEKATHFSSYFPIPYVGNKSEDLIELMLKQISPDYLKFLEEEHFGDPIKFEPTWVNLSGLEINFQQSSDYRNHALSSWNSMNARFEGLDSMAEFGFQIEEEVYESLTKLVAGPSRYLPVFEVSLQCTTLHS